MARATRSQAVSNVPRVTRSRGAPIPDIPLSATHKKKTVAPRRKKALRATPKKDEAKLTEEVDPEQVLTLFFR